MDIMVTQVSFGEMNLKMFLEIKHHKNSLQVFGEVGS